MHASGGSECSRRQAAADETAARRTGTRQSSSRCGPDELDDAESSRLEQADRWSASRELAAPLVFAIGAHGVVASPQELKILRARFSLDIVTPAFGIVGSG